MPHISVTIPVFNRAHLIGFTIESVLRQSFTDWDLVIVDDASTDETVSVIQRFANEDSRIKCYVNEHNLGLTRNWNRCLDLSTGPLIQILLSDDLVDSGYLEAVSSVFEKYPSVGIVAANCRYIDVSGKLLDDGNTEDSKMYRAGDEAVSIFLKRYPHVSSIVFRKNCVDKLGKYDERIWHGPDVEYDTRIARHYDYFHFGQVYTSFRRHGRNMGALEYLRNDFLEVDNLKFRLSWGCLSDEALRLRGIDDLDRYVASYTARSALTGVIISIAYGCSRLGFHYLRQAVRYDQNIIGTFRFWKSLAMLVSIPVSRFLLIRRMKLSNEDQAAARLVLDRLNSLKKNVGSGI